MCPRGGKLDRTNGLPSITDEAHLNHASRCRIHAPWPNGKRSSHRRKALGLTQEALAEWDFRAFYGCRFCGGNAAIASRLLPPIDPAQVGPALKFLVELLRPADRR